MTAPSGPSDSVHLTDSSSVTTQRAGGAPTRRLGHIPAFDGLRGVMLIVVVVAHMYFFIPHQGLLLIPGGTVALDSFFVLSGFLITTLLLREQQGKGKVKAGKFYQRRALRLLPALIFLLIVHWIYSYIVGLSQPLERSSLLSIIFYYANYKSALGPQSFVGGAPFALGLGHLWSLSVEEQFYFVWPVVVILVLGVKRRLSIVVTVLVAIIAFETVYRWVGYHNIGDFFPLFARTDYRADAMLWGALLAHLWIRDKEPKRYVHIAAWFAAAFMFWVLFTVQENGPFLYKGGLTLVDLSCFILVLAILQGRWFGTHLFKWKPFVMLGTVSYGVYLWHVPVFIAVWTHTKGWDWPPQVALALAITAFFTAISWFLLEKRALQWKARSKVVSDDAVPSTSSEPAASTAPAPEPAPVPPASATATAPATNGSNGTAAPVTSPVANGGNGQRRRSPSRWSIHR
jgi:peptidoglycan/LPS O-acetylase OafA/YrhL